MSERCSTFEFIEEFTSENTLRMEEYCGKDSANFLLVYQKPMEPDVHLAGFTSVRTECTLNAKHDAIQNAKGTTTKRLRSAHCPSLVVAVVVSVFFFISSAGSEDLNAISPAVARARRGEEDEG